MNLKLNSVISLGLVPSALLCWTSCSTAPEGERATLVAAQQGVPGGIIVQTHKVTATVTAVDAPNRKVTLVTPDGKKETCTVGPEVVNLDQVRIGDQVKATVTEELAVYVRKAGTPTKDGEATAVALAPVGAKPGVVMANTIQTTASVKAIDLKHHKATLLFPDGKTKTFSVRPDVDLNDAQIGDQVVIRSTESVAVLVEKP